MRIVSLLPSATDMIHELRLMDALVGVTQDCTWPPEVRSKPLVARNKIDLSGLTSAQIDEIISVSKSGSHSLVRCRCPADERAEARSRDHPGPLRGVRGIER